MPKDKKIPPIISGNQFMTVRFGFIMPEGADAAGLLHFYAEQPLLDCLQYTADEIAEMKEEFISKIVFPEDRYILTDMVKQMKPRERIHCYYDGFRLQPKKGELLFVIWKAGVSERQIDGSPTVYACEGIILGKNHHFVEIMKAWVRRCLSPALKKNIGLLSKSECKVLRLISKGKTNSEIAEILFVSTDTVSSHKKSIMNKLELSTAAELANIACEICLFYWFSECD
jgi:DNA-binding CsgD family transcriptional regulator